jgi:hypothetical protein
MQTVGLRRFYQYVVNIGRWSPYEGGQLDRFHCNCFLSEGNIRFYGRKNRWFQLRHKLMLSL